MKRLTLIVFVLIYSVDVHCQRNCNVFKWEADSCRYKACTYLEKAPKFFQLRREYHEVYDKALEICPEYSDAYRAKSVAYLKTGDFISWKKLMDKAVEIKPADHLGYRGWGRFQFFRDYNGAIQDIERLDDLVNHDIGYSQNGTYHLNIAKALCYKMIGNKNKAISIIENQFKKDSSSIGVYDYLHLGVLYYEIKNYSKAIKTFEKQSQEYNCAENAFYTALTYKSLGNFKEYEKYLLESEKLYLAKTYMYDPYTHQIDKVYLSEIKNEINRQKK